MASITVEIELSDRFIYDVLTTVVESGAIDYWASFSEVNREVDTQDVISAVIQDIDAEYHNDRGEPEFANEELGYDQIVNGIQKLLDGTVPVAKYIRNYVDNGVRSDDAGEIDADAADAIVQAGVLGELIYG